jgi:hypothetical protein
VQSVLGLANEVPALVDAVESIAASSELSADDAETLLNASVAIIGTIRGLADGGVPGGLASAADPLGRSDFWQTFPLELAEGLLVNYLEHTHPAVFTPLHLLGIIDTQWTPAGAAPFRVDYLKTTLNFDRLGTLFTDPGALAKQLYGWGGTLDYTTLFSRLTRVLVAFGFRAQTSQALHPLISSRYYSAPPAGLRQLWFPLLSTEAAQANNTTLYLEASFYLLPIPAGPYPSGGPPAGLLLAPYLDGSATASFSLGHSVSLAVKGSLTVDGLTGLEILPGHMGAYLGSLASTSFDLGTTLSFKPPTPSILLGRPDSHRLQIDDATLSIDEPSWFRLCKTESTPEV